MSLDALNDPAKTALGKRQQLQEVANAPDESLKGLKPGEIRELAKRGAALDENGNPLEDDAEAKKDGDGKKNEEKPSSLKIKINLDLDVEIHLTARIKGDITIGLL